MFRRDLRSGREVFRGAVAALVGLLGTTAGCTHGGNSSIAGLAAHSRPTCLVLSVGGPQGLAHLGALEAIRQEGVELSCVVGNSMGSLVGALYSVDPDGDTRQHFQDVADRYIEETESEAASGGLLLGLLGAFVLGPAGAALGGAVGMGSVDQINHARLVTVLDQYVDHAEIEELPVPFETSYVVQRSERLTFLPVRSGNLSAAVGGSIANPLIFDELDIRSGGPLDPGLDRVSAVPVLQACESFPDHGLLAINVTGEAAIVPAGRTCAAAEIMVTVPEVSAGDVLTKSEVLDAVVAAGYDAVHAWFQTREGRAFVHVARGRSHVETSGGRTIAAVSR